jgi:hypothetical protein
VIAAARLIRSLPTAAWTLALLLPCAAPLRAQQDSTVGAPRGYSGGGLSVLATEYGRIPFFTYRTTHFEGALVAPDLAANLFAIPIPLLLTLDAHLGVAIPTGSDAVRLVVSGGPSLLMPLVGEGPGFSVGFGAGAGLIVRSGLDHAVRFDVGRRYIRELDGQDAGVWYFGLSFLTPDRVARRPACPCSQR